MPAEQIDHLAVVEAFPEYEVDAAPLGTGGMKNAYRVNIDGTTAVLKVLRDPLEPDDEDGAVTLPARFQREIEIMSSIDHPGIVRVLQGPDVRSIDGALRVWYVEPYYPGGTLADRLGTPWADDAVIDLLAALTGVGTELAEHRVVHRDIKPSNIVYDEADRPVLLDLGIAYFPDLTPLTVDWGWSPRTDRYAAPEQFLRRSYATIDHRTDMFLMGLVAFEARTGAHPFNPEEPAGYVERVMTGTLDVESLTAAQVRPPLQRVLRRLLAPGMSQRYRTYPFLRDALEACR